MAQRTVQQYMMDIFRATGGQAHMGQVQQALSDALKLMDSKGNYVFLGTTSLLSTDAPYSTGTVSVTGGTATVTGTGTAWSPFWVNREIKFGARELPYGIASVDSPTSLTLAQNLSGADIVNGSYVMYRAVYPLPTDCEPGRDQMIRGGIAHGRRGRIVKFTRPLHESRATDLRGGGNILWFTDEMVDTQGIGYIRLYPYPSAVYDLRLFYYRSMRLPTGLADTLPIPPAFEMCPIKLATAAIKKGKGMQGWMQDEKEGNDMMNDLYNRHAASAAYEQMSDPDDNYGDPAGLYGESDFLYTWGAI